MRWLECFTTGLHCARTSHCEPPGSGPVSTKLRDVAHLYSQPLLTRHLRPSLTRSLHALAMPPPASKSAFRRVRGKSSKVKFAPKQVARLTAVETSSALGPDGRLRPVEQNLLYDVIPPSPKRARLETVAEDLSVTTTPTTDGLPCPASHSCEAAIPAEGNGGEWVDVDAPLTKKAKARKKQVRNTLQFM